MKYRVEGAKNATGEFKKGTIEASDISEAAELAKAWGLKITKIEPEVQFQEIPTAKIVNKPLPSHETEYMQYSETEQKYNPTYAFLFAILFPGAGYVYINQVGHALLLWVIIVITSPTVILPFIAWIVSMMHCYSMAEDTK